MYYEDVEWCARQRKNGRRVAVCLRSQIIHEARGSDRGENASYYIARNSLLYADTFSPSQRRRVRALSRLNLCYHRLRLLVARPYARARREAIVHGYRDGLLARSGPRPHRTTSRQQ